MSLSWILPYLLRPTPHRASTPPARKNTRIELADTIAIKAIIPINKRTNVIITCAFIVVKVKLFANII